MGHGLKSIKESKSCCACDNSKVVESKSMCSLKALKTFALIEPVLRLTKVFLLPSKKLKIYIV